MIATATVTYLDDSTITITADTERGVADLQRFARSAHLPGESRFTTAVGDRQQPIIIDHAKLAGVGLVTS